MTKHKYIGITIGPTYKTLLKAEKTREIWGASYLLSYLCRNLVKSLHEEEKRNAEFKILLPSPKAVDAVKPGVGLYPDHIILQTLIGEFETVQGIVNAVKKDVVTQMLENIRTYPAFDPFAKLLKKSVGENWEAASKFLNEYLQVYSIEVSKSHLDDLKGKDNKELGVVKAMNVMLDHIELRSSITGFDPDPVKVFLRGINHSFLLRDAFADGFLHFPSLPEITTTELRFVSEDIRKRYDAIVKRDYRDLVEKEKKDTAQLAEGDLNIKSDEAEDALLDKLFELEGIEQHKRTYHKYVAIVHADGDRMGTLLGKIKPEDVIGFSEDLLAFAIEANNIIAGDRFTKNDITNWGYGGAPLYIGGDDLVFFAPVANRVKEGDGWKFQTVFHLIQQLDDAFNKIFNGKDKDGKDKYPDLKADERPCMTYGVSITYGKFPLREAYKQSRDLMEAVKNDDYKSRNRVNFKIQKHSGQWFGGVIDKNDTDSWKDLIQLLDENNLSNIELDKSESFINSMSQKLRFYQAAIEARALKDDAADLEISMKALFDHALNEPIHKRHEQYLKSICTLLTRMLEKSKSNKGRTPTEWIEEAINTLHGILRFIHFIRSNEFRN